MRCTILFGSGADTDCCRSLPAGQEFIHGLLQDSYKSERKAILGEDVSNFSLIHPNSINVFLQTIYLNRDTEETKEIFGNKLNKYIKYYNDDPGKPNYKTIKIDCGKFLENIKKYGGSEKNTKTIKKQAQARFFLENAVFFDTIDEKFNSLRLPDDDNSKIKRVKNTYLTIYLTILEKLYTFQDDFQWSYKNIIDHIENDYDIEKNGDVTYYDIVKNSGKEFNIVTTNYTKLAEKYTCKEVAYLHGKMTWFEDIKRLTIYDCENPEEKRLAIENEKYLIPFILIPSGVKPIIATKQIKQFSNFIRNLEESDVLCVIGYKFNSEDNHINSIIADWLRQENHSMVYFNFKNNLNFNRLTWTGDFKVKDCNGEKVSDKSIEESKILNITIDDKNAREKFRDFINQC